MDELLSDFIVETGESLEQIDAALVAFEQKPSDQAILRQVFRLVHTIKGTCGFLELSRLEALTHAAENLMGRYRDGLPPSEQGVTTILQVIDQIKAQLQHMQAHAGVEPEGHDHALIEALNVLAGRADEQEDRFGAEAPFDEVPQLDRWRKLFAMRQAPTTPCPWSRCEKKMM